MESMEMFTSVGNPSEIRNWIAIHMRIGLIHSHSKSWISGFTKSTFHIRTGLGIKIFQILILFRSIIWLHSTFPYLWNLGFSESDFGSNYEHFWAFGTVKFREYLCAISTSLFVQPIWLSQLDKGSGNLKVGTKLSWILKIIADLQNTCEI